MTNAIVIMLDDMMDVFGYRELYGHPILTPNLDALCARATRFAAANALIPVCMPSRAAMFSGWSPARSGVLANMDPDWFESRINVRDNLLSVLKRSGAWVGMAGKIMHLYGAQPKEIRDQLCHDTLTTFSFQPDTAVGAPGVIRYHPEAIDCISIEGKDAEFYDYQMFQWGIDKLETLPTDRPWFMAIGSKHPHSTLEAPKWAYDAIDRTQITFPEEWMSKAYPTSFAERYTPKSNSSPQRSNLEAWTYRAWAYLAAIYHVDHHIGRLLDALDASPFADDTAIIVASDHGFSLGHLNWWGKFTQWEESARTPVIVRAPGQTVASVQDTPITLMDVFPTVLDFMGVDIPKRIKGQSLRPLLPDQTGTYEDRGAVTFVHGTCSLRHGEHRYILYPDHPHSEELYNVVTDPLQMNNLVTSNPTLAAEMRSRIVLEMARYDMVQASPLLPSPREAAEYALYGNEPVRGGHGDDVFGLYGSATPSRITDDGGRDRVNLNGWAHGVTYTLPEGIEDMRVSVTSGGTSGRAPVVLNDADNHMVSATGFDAWGMGGNDTIIGNGGDVYGGDGDDLIDGSARQRGDAGNDTLVGMLTLGEGGDGNDLIHKPRGASTLSGGAGNDTILGEGYNETLLGGSGEDLLNGGAGNDILDGGTGSDTLIGGHGDDTIRTLGDDVVTGGNGLDRFEIGPVGSVQIGDWQVGEVIDVSSWGPVSITVERQTDALVYVTDGRRSVMVASAGAITVAQVEASLVRAA